MGALVGWARVSTTEQELTAQLVRLKELGCEPIYCARQSSVSNQHELMLEDMLAYIREGDKVVVTKIDRLGRSLSQVLNTLEKIRQKGATFVALDQNIDTTKDDPVSKAMIQLLGMFAELERNMIKERMAEGKRISGNYGGRPSKLTKEQRTEILKALSKGEPKTKLSQKYGVSRATIRNIELEMEKIQGEEMGVQLKAVVNADKILKERELNK